MQFKRFCNAHYSIFLFDGVKLARDCFLHKHEMIRKRENTIYMG